MRLSTKNPTRITTDDHPGLLRVLGKKQLLGMSGNGCFGKIVVCDFEYEAAPGDFPHPLCMVAFVLDDKLRHERTVRLWRGDFPSEPRSTSDLILCLLPIRHGPN